MDISVDRARFNMIQQQVRPWDVVDDRVLSVMAEIPREQFVPDAYRSLAFADIEVPIGAGQTMLAPRVVGRMLQALDIRPGDRILEIGTGTGYITACLSRLGGRVVSMEIQAELAGQAQETLQALSLRRLEVRVGDGLAGPVEGHPFDVIAVTGSMPSDEPLAALEDQLAPNGRLFAIVGEAPVMEAVLITRIDASQFSREALFETSVPPLANVPEPERFVF
ncbi:MAG: protein-L-isoaspartate O-methyltransferase [Pseudomonadota bacterium]|nr:protein-L-isoaspartate O-methyltransferase [Pseudomonadota bacterium]